METSKEWQEESGSGIILDAARASLELIDKDHVAKIDDIEVGARISGNVRLAIILVQTFTKQEEHWN